LVKDKKGRGVVMMAYVRFWSGTVALGFLLHFNYFCFHLAKIILPFRLVQGNQLAVSEE
jgi:hypothetical protein